jgi:hypothetical protein
MQTPTAEDSILRAVELWDAAQLLKVEAASMKPLRVA